MVACHWQAARTTEVESSRWRKAKQEEPRTQIDGHHGHRDDHHGHWDDHHGHWDDHHGHWDDHQDLWSEYLGRSLDTLANISLAQFVINYRSGSEDGNHSDYKNTIKLLDMPKLSEQVPGESSFVVRRRYPTKFLKDITVS